jgi:alanyl-tRNA synthetase
LKGIHREGGVAKDEREMIGNLSDQVAKYKLSNTNLNTKVTQLTDELEKKKKELVSLRKQLALRKAAHPGKSDQQMELELVPGKVRAVSPEPARRPVSSQTQQLANDTHANLLEVARNLKAK